MDKRSQVSWVNRQLRSFAHFVVPPIPSRLRVTMTFRTLLSLCLVVSSALATPVQIRSSPITLSIAINVNATGGAKALINRDRARAQALFSNAQAKAPGSNLASIPLPVTDAAVNIFLHLVPCAINNNSPISKSTPRALVSVMARIHSSWTQGVPIPGSVLGNPTNLVQIPITQGIQYQCCMAAVVSQARNVSLLPPFPIYTMVFWFFSYKCVSCDIPLVTDTVKIGSASISSQSIGVASTSTGFAGMYIISSRTQCTSGTCSYQGLTASSVLGLSIRQLTPFKTWSPFPQSLTT